ncbi:rhomboid family intramembrane serine protease GlpG [Xenorhabdus sp. M]|uniref:Rhomboid family intramembrane serine protease GlpG n=1 Tax=Xenorhabdus szentirmaii TaxID=290112 RepID=A0AAW3YSS4_9GAMM|nr:rhomboid family intramembrane serine protease GlpG [Xenorhabdus sp. M]MBD2800134.1 rhomboid family intramembrane serine protease GlpG [Xenorhabdus sp. M]
MINVTSISNPRLAQAFIDYMATQGVHLVMRPTGEPSVVEIWLEDDNQLTQVEQELQHFVRDPLNARYQAASWQTGKSDSPFKYRTHLDWNALKTQSGPMTITVLALCILVYLGMNIIGGEQIMLWLAWPNSTQYLELWRWVSYALMHFSLTHILFNLVLWWYLGSQVERNINTGKLFEITIVSAFFSGWAQSLYSASHFGGLSGVIYALLGYVWLTGEISSHRGISAPRGLIVITAILLFFSSPSHGSAAHISGLIIGLLMGLWDNLRKQKNQ